MADKPKYTVQKRALRAELLAVEARTWTDQATGQAKPYALLHFREGSAGVPASASVWDGALLASLGNMGPGSAIEIEIEDRVLSSQVTKVRGVTK